MKRISIHTALWLLICLTFAGCSREITLQEGEFLLNKQRFVGNEQIDTETLESLIPLAQKPNSRPLSFLQLPVTPKIWYLNFGKNTFRPEKVKGKMEEVRKTLEDFPDEAFASTTQNRRYQKLVRRLNRYQENLEIGASAFWRNLGEEPTIISQNQMLETAVKIRKYLQDIGFRDAQVQVLYDSIKRSDKPRINVIYKVQENQPYRMDSIMYDSPDQDLLQVFQRNQHTSFLKKDQRLDQLEVEKEINRLESLARQAGYYNFLGQYIRTYVTNQAGDYQKFLEQKRGDLHVRIDVPPNANRHKIYTIRGVTFKGFDNTLVNRLIQPDTLTLDGVAYITLDKRIPVNFIHRRLLVRPGQVYNSQTILETQRQLSLLNQFQFAGTLFKEVDSTGLDLEIFSPSLDRFTVNANLGPNNIQNIWGGGLTGSLIMRNTLKRLETFEVGGRFSLDGQPALLDRAGFKRSVETGANIALTFPTLILPTRFAQLLALKNPTTQVGVGVNYSVPIWGERFNLKLTQSYSFQPSRFSSVSVSLFDLSLINTNYFTQRAEGLQFYNSLVQLQSEGNNLKITFDPQFVSSVHATYQFNNQNLQKPYSSSRFFRVFLESGGTLLNVWGNQSRLGLIEQFFPIQNANAASDSSRQYFQFVKLNIDFRQYKAISSTSSWAYRVNVGVTNPYGKNRALPYEKNFFAGGSNSVRAWSPRSLGVGSAPPDITSLGNIIPQPGDILLEGSIEYRKKIGQLFGDLQFATFIDAGNIWKWHPVPTKLGQAQFDLSRFYREIAVGTGFGFRLDFTYFLFRLDFGIKVLDPAQPIGQRFVLDNFKLGFNSTYGLLPQIGIGYPF